MYVETLRNPKADLVVESISTNNNTDMIIVRVCNRGEDMPYQSWVTEISNTTTNNMIRSYGSRLTRGGCTDIFSTHQNLGIYRSGGYNLQVKVDTENVVEEYIESNNTTYQYLQIWKNY